MSRVKRLVVIGRTALTFAIGFGALCFAQGTPPGGVDENGHLNLAPEVWLMLLGGAITVGINLQMLRSMRTDLKDHIKKFDEFVKVMPDEYVRRDYWKEAVDDIRNSIAALARRSR